MQVRRLSDGCRYEVDMNYPRDILSQSTVFILVDGRAGPFWQTTGFWSLSNKIHSIEALELQGSGIVPLEQLVHHSMFNLATFSFPVEGNRHMRYSIPVLGTFAVNRWSRYYPRQSVCQYKRTVYARQSSVDRWGETYPSSPVCHVPHISSSRL